MISISELSENITPEQSAKLERYVSELELFNPVYHLVSCRSRDELLIKHIADCAAGADVIRASLGPDNTVADFGTGAGLPGLVLAILMEDVSFTLIERMSRRVDFLRNAVLRCKLCNVEILSEDIKCVERVFDCITFRAFRPLNEIIGQVGRLLSPEGCVCAYKAQKDYVQKELSTLTGWRHSLVRLNVPMLDEERSMLILHKEGEKKSG